MYAETPQQDLDTHQLRDVWLTHGKRRAYKLQDEDLPKAPRSGVWGRGKGFICSLWSGSRRGLQPIFDPSW